MKWNKKAQSTEMGILILMIIFLLGSATFIPIVQSEYGQPTTTSSGATQVSGTTDTEATALNLFTIIFTFFQLVTLDFGDSLGLPLWLDFIYTIISIITLIILIRIVVGAIPFV